MTEVSPLKLPNAGRWAVACYVPIFNIVVCILAAVRLYTDDLVMLHARQGLVLFVMWFLTIVVALISPILSLFLWVVVLALHGLGMFMALTGKTSTIPIVGTFAMMLPRYFLCELLTGNTVEKK